VTYVPSWAKKEYEQWLAAWFRLPPFLKRELKPVSAEAVDISGLVKAELCEGGFGVEIDAERKRGALEMIDIDSVYG